MAYSDVQVTFEIGHRSSLRTKLTPEGFTHDWEIFVRGVDGTDISNFVDRVVFYLHETFPKPKRVIKDPPYSVKESGYAGFNLTIDVYFKNKDEPKKFKYYYDLELQTSGPAITKVVREKYVFPNPLGDFRKKLIRGGGIGVNGGDGLVVDKQPAESGASGAPSSKSVASSQGKTKPSGDVTKKHKIKEPKPEEFRPSNQFSELFGPPIKTSKVSPDPKKQSPSSSKALSVVKPSKPIEKSSSSNTDKPASESKAKHSSQKEVKREKEGSSREEKKEKRDKSKEFEKKAVKAPSPLPKPPKEEPKRPDESKDHNEETKSEKKKKDKKSKEEKSKKDKHKEHDKPSEKSIEKFKEKDSKKSPKAIPVSREPEKVEKSKDKEKHRDGEKDRQKHKHKKKEKEKSKKSKEEGKDRDRVKKDKQESKDRKNGIEENSLIFKAPEPHSPSPPVCPPPSKPLIEKATAAQSKEKTTKNPLSTLFEELSDHESSDSNNSPLSGDEDLLEFSSHSKSKDLKQVDMNVKKEAKERESSIEKGGGSTKTKQKEDVEKRRDRSEGTKDEKRRKRKGSHNRDMEEIEPVVKSTKQEVSRSEPDLPPPPSPSPTRSTQADFSEQYVSELKELQHKIMSLDDDEELQRLVDVIKESGQYETTKMTFDFDLCALDKKTVKRLQDFFRNL